MNTAFTKRLTALLLFCLVSAAFCQQDLNFNYRDEVKDVSDISFYQPSPTDTQYPVTTESEKVKNVILLIGDGMGLSQVRLAALKAGGTDIRLYMEKMPVTGILTTEPHGRFITDSAAAATAIACGIKTTNGTLGQDPDGLKYFSFAELHKIRGGRCGLVATSELTHATPAGFASHVESRGMERAIAVQMIENGFDVLFAGGKRYFLPKSDEKSNREDDRDLIKQALNSGYVFIEHRNQLRNLQPGTNKVLGLFSNHAMTTFAPEPTISEMARTAIKVLSNKNENGFFLMVEGSQIDWAGHANNVENIIKQTLEFDMAVKEALDFAVKDKNTLVLVTADHETGGLVVTGGSSSENLAVEWATKSHSASHVPLFAYGPQALNFTGVYHHTDLAAKIAEIMGIENFPRTMQKQPDKTELAAE
ncbi:Alkaline phosphatase 3 precursor [Limihaloglobus sulfuriphilus]|uniref:Alkaline phosphatase 3 n=1 Tax=Limihaloglobus sulfuriphilus TaxID=1851148 RepID=A0A1Q2MEU0_9BACT|nr:alkaline phosphatase [Limihaloglobus sulfuriphilus]AQQ70762.1 Alkaline phosphatase 3 precursor [Limihaloglobus sulfuriphilus]